MTDRPRILVADDVPENVRLLEAVLVPRGYEVVSASDGRQALEAARSARPDLVLLDVVMPELDGFEVCRQLRAREDTAMLPVIMLTASEGTEKTKAIDAGADDFIPKPFNHDELLARVRSLLRIKRYHDEIAELNRTLEERVQTQLQELDRLQQLQRFLSPQLAEAIVSSGDESILSSHRRQVAMVFADLRGWTSFADSVEPEELMLVLGEFHETIGRLVSRFDATVGFLAGRRRPALLQRPDRDPGRRPAGRPARLRAARGDGRADAALAEARPRARLRRRHRARLCDVWRGRLRGSLRLRRHRGRHEPRVAARGRGDRRPGAHRPAPVRRGRGPRRGGAGRRDDHSRASSARSRRSTSSPSVSMRRRRARCRRREQATVGCPRGRRPAPRGSAGCPRPVPRRTSRRTPSEWFPG